MLAPFWREDKKKTTFSQFRKARDHSPSETDAAPERQLESLANESYRQPLAGINRHISKDLAQHLERSSVHASR
jgi:hypothetical protein